MDDKILKLIQFIVATAVRKGFRNLWAIHIVKYLYIVDYYNARSEGKTITGQRWKFWTYGPWTTDSHNAIHEARDKGFISSRPKVTKHLDLDEESEYEVYYVESEEISDRGYEKLGREVIPNIKTRLAVEGNIKKYGLRTKPLLNYIYNQTEPMQEEIRQGEYLNFDNLSWPETTEKIKSKPLKARTIKKAKEVLKRMRNTEKKNYSPPKGKFDEAYFKFIDTFNDEDALNIEDGVEVIASVKNVAI